MDSDSVCTLVFMPDFLYWKMISPPSIDTHHEVSVANDLQIATQENFMMKKKVKNIHIFSYTWK